MDRREQGPFARGRSEPLRIELLGGFRVSVGEKTIREDAWRLKKAASLVKLLALAPGHRLHRERVQDLLWPDASSKAASNNLRQVLFVARRTLGTDSETASRYLSLRGDLLALCPEDELRVDVAAFEASASAARRGGDPAAFDDALGLYAGELLPADRYEDWVEGRRAELRWTFLSLLVGVAKLYEERGEYDPAVETLRRAVEEEPTLEEAHAGIMRLYARMGRRDQALEQYRHLEEVLAREAGSEPGPALRALGEEIADGRFPGFAGPGGGAPRGQESVEAHNLPSPRTSFVGRRAALAETRRALAATRLLTLTGPGGAGKTRLALKTAADLAGGYADGVWFVELAPLSREDLVPQAVAQALGVREQPGRALTQTLVRELRERETLLILDNCEHLVEAAARMTDALLSACPRLRVLATSREALGVEGEVVWQVPSLTVPEPHTTPTVESLEGSESARLFAERARQRKHTFSLTPSNSPAVAAVCRRLDGIPLAIELAAARVGTLTVEQVAERLENSLALLTGGLRTAAHRQRTMRATLEWSHELLDGTERALFERLSVFAGGWKLEVAEAVCSGEGLDEDEVVQALSNLADKSLILAEEVADGGVRYRMLEPVRQFGLERLEAGGRAEHIRERHARHFVALSEAAEAELAGVRQAEILEQLGVEYGNLSAALSWTLDGEGAQGEERAELGLRLAASLWLFWDIRGLGEEGRRWLEAAVRRRGGIRSTARARALDGLGWITLYRGDYDRAVVLLEESLTLSRELGDGSGAAISLAYLGRATVHRGDRRGALVLRDRAEKLRHGPLDQKALAELFSFMAIVALSERDLARMEALFEESLSAFREAGDARGITRCTVSLGLAALVRGRYDRAVERLNESLSRLKELRDRTGVAYVLLGLAGVASFGEDPDRAARLWGAAEAAREAIGLSLSSLDRSHYGYDDRVSVARDALGEDAFAAAWAEGRAMTFDDVYRYAFVADVRSKPEVRGSGRLPVKPRTRADVLTKREREVAILAARELTNRQIASQLFISERTVATHVHKILEKLGLRSRTQIPAWARERQPLP